MTTPAQIVTTDDLQFGGEIGTIPAGTTLDVTGEMYSGQCWRCQYGPHAVCVNKQAAQEL